MESGEGLNMRHVISALVENKSGVLAHVAGLFSSRGFNIDSLTVGRTENPGVSRMTIVVEGDEAVLEQVRKQLGKVIDVLKVSDFSGRDIVQRDLALVKVNAPPAKRAGDRFAHRDFPREGRGHLLDGHGRRAFRAGGQGGRVRGDGAALRDHASWSGPDSSPWRAGEQK